MKSHQSFSKKSLGLLGCLLVMTACSDDVGFDSLESIENPVSVDPIPAPAPQPSPNPAPGPQPQPNPVPGFFSKTMDINVGNQSGQADILFVIDNSGSMAEEQGELAKRISGFMNLISDLDWQIAMTTTDPKTYTYDKDREYRNWGDGQLRPFDRPDGRKFVLKAGEQSADRAEESLARAIHMGIQGDSDERGIRNVSRAIDRLGQGSAAHREFFRPQASLEVVLISDEDECDTPDCTGGVWGQSVPQNLVEKVATQFGAQKKFNFHSIIWMPNDRSCTTGQTMGSAYAELSRLTEGVTGSICASSYSRILRDIGERVVEEVKGVDLDCSPDQVKGQGGRAKVLVTLQGGDLLLEKDFQLKGKKLLFKKALPPGRHQVTYLCPEVK